MKSEHKARAVVTSGNVVRVHVSPEALYNLEATQAITRTLLGRLGCTTCCSGFQFLFQLEEQELAVGA